MKYIRTEKGIYNIFTNGIGFDEKNKEYFVSLKQNKPFICLEENEKQYIGKIIKQADTIEELCDCFIKIKRKNNCKDYILKFDYKDLEELKKQFIKFPQSPVYAGIQIDDKGIIYKAKMKGILSDGKIEWELL